MLLVQEKNSFLNKRVRFFLLPFGGGGTVKARCWDLKAFVSEDPNFAAWLMVQAGFRSTPNKNSISNEVGLIYFVKERLKKAVDRVPE